MAVFANILELRARKYAPVFGEGIRKITRDESARQPIFMGAGGRAAGRTYACDGRRLLKTEIAARIDDGKSAAQTERRPLAQCNFQVWPHPEAEQIGVKLPHAADTLAIFDYRTRAARIV